jgi:hypothetical protein
MVASRPVRPSAEDLCIRGCSISIPGSAACGSARSRSLLGPIH